MRFLKCYFRFLKCDPPGSAGSSTGLDLASPLGVYVPTVSEWLAILEVTSQIVHQLNAGRARALYYFRDQQGLEVELVCRSAKTGWR